jgi:2-polyprenyl-3-methyl-5-hydroxy-6-metoxy-1,4-benzoquinol methylase
LGLYSMTSFLLKLFLRTPLAKSGENLWEANCQNFMFSLNKRQKLLITAYLIARDTLDGTFPPNPAESLEAAYRREIEYLDNLPGVSRNAMNQIGMSKPFWGGREMHKLLRDFMRIERILKNANILPPARILELGCGAGWLSELLARMGYEVTGSTLDPSTVTLAKNRAAAFEHLAIKGKLQYRTAAMETLSKDIDDENEFDAVIIYEALHHVYDWRLALDETRKILRSDGLLIIANEPNLIHTAKSYRVAKLTGTREIGLNRSRLADHLKTCGFHNVRFPHYLLTGGVLPIWIAAKRQNRV